mmetsp:Transcript_22213/g.69331  ORF Transcript_22213/g.69331 Transcript_22213/m.69331 type:complete len:247 (+) Transcript_22213:640-1380(+)
MAQACSRSRPRATRAARRRVSLWPTPPSCSSPPTCWASRPTSLPTPRRAWYWPSRRAVPGFTSSATSTPAPRTTPRRASGRARRVPSSRATGASARRSSRWTGPSGSSSTRSTAWAPQTARSSSLPPSPGRTARPAGTRLAAQAGSRAGAGRCGKVAFACQPLRAGRARCPRTWSRTRPCAPSTCCPPLPHLLECKWLTPTPAWTVWTRASSCAPRWTRSTPGLARARARSSTSAARAPWPRACAT